MFRKAIYYLTAITLAAALSCNKSDYEIRKVSSERETVEYLQRTETPDKTEGSDLEQLLAEEELLMEKEREAEEREQQKESAKVTEAVIPEAPKYEAPLPKVKKIIAPKQPLPAERKIVEATPTTANVNINVSIRSNALTYEVGYCAIETKKIVIMGRVSRNQSTKVELPFGTYSFFLRRGWESCPTPGHWDGYSIHNQQTVTVTLGERYSVSLTSGLKQKDRELNECKHRNSLGSYMKNDVCR